MEQQEKTQKQSSNSENAPSTSASTEDLKRASEYAFRTMIKHARRHTNARTRELTVALGAAVDAIDSYLQEMEKPVEAEQKDDDQPQAS
jgi:hypothetical protein